MLKEKHMNIGQKGLSRIQGISTWALIFIRTEICRKSSIKQKSGGT